MIRIEAYAVLDGLVLHIAASNLKDPSTLAGGNGMSVHRVIPVEHLEDQGVDACILEAVKDVFALYAGLAQFALR
jgi:hypothetical protein